jgi:hypothetical protein
VIRAWRALPSERRLAAGGAFGLFVTLFLPWYQETVVVAGKSPATASLTGWASFSFVEAAVLLVAAGVLVLLFERAEGRAFHLPGGDGWVVTAAGAWTCVLVMWRIIDKQSAHVSGPGATVSGVEWGIFIALAVAALLTYAGSRIRAAGRPEPALAEDDYDFPMPSRRTRERRPSRGEATRRDEASGRTEAGGRTEAARRAESARRADRRKRRAAASPPPASAPSAETKPTRVRRRRTGSLPFPVPDALDDPPALRIGDHRAKPDTAAQDPPRDAPLEPPTQATDDQLTIPFDDVDR